MQTAAATSYSTARQAYRSRNTTNRLPTCISAAPLCFSRASRALIGRIRTSSPTAARARAMPPNGISPVFYADSIAMVASSKKGLRPIIHPRRDLHVPNNRVIFDQHAALCEFAVVLSRCSGIPKVCSTSVPTRTAPARLKP